MICLATNCLKNVECLCELGSAITLNPRGLCESKVTQQDLDKIEMAKGCPHGYDDCVLNPLYNKFHHPKWWAECGSKLVCSAEGCEDGSQYDDEDK